MDDWYWAARDKEPARDAFIIANGRDELWRRVRLEIDPDERCAWMPVHRGSQPTLAHMLDISIRYVPMYRINMDRFVFEAAQIPVFAKFLRDAPANLSDYVANSLFPEAAIAMRPYTAADTSALGARVSATLGIEDDWYDR